MPRQVILLSGPDWQLLPMMPREWEWKRVWEQPRAVYPSLWIPAAVPGSVQADAQEAGLIPDFTVGLQSRCCEWTSERDWVYLRSFPTPERHPGEVVRLCFEGVDHACHVFLNGRPLGDHEGMYTPFEFEVTGLLRDGAEPNALVVVVEHAPREVGQIGRTSEVRLWKARFAYDWDWCTRLVPVGIWDDVALVRTGPAWLRDVQVRPAVSEDLSEAHVKVVPHLGGDLPTDAELSLEVTLAGAPVAAVVGSPHESPLRVRLPAPQLWWPNGHGEQPLYEAHLRLRRGGEALDGCRRSFGLRRVEAVANEGAPAEALPYTLEVNGKRIFLKGANWAPIHQLYGRPWVERYARWVRLAQEAHLTLLRVWGGGLLEREQFYDLCDRAGIMVWQEFIQSSSGIDNRPATDEAYLAYIRDQAEQTIPRRRHHPSLVIWCGGNELMADDWTPLDEQHPALRVLGDCVRRLDPDRHYLPTSASGPVANASLEHIGRMHDVHGPWVYVGPEEHYRLYNGIDPLLHSEFGVEGAGNLETLRAIAPDEQLWPPDETNPLWMHHGSWWIQRGKIEGLFGAASDLATFIRASQYLQAEGLRYCVEANRRRKWRCSGTMPWQYNETWPNTSGTNVLDFRGVPKAAYYYLRRAYEPVHVSAAYEQLGWHGEERFRAQLWAHSSLGERHGRTRWQLTDAAGDVLGSGETEALLPANGALRLAAVDVALPPRLHGLFVLWLELHSDDALLSRNEYVFSRAPAPILRPLLEPSGAALRLQSSCGTVCVGNEGTGVALGVRLWHEDETQAIWSENYLALRPGEEHVVHQRGPRGRVWAEALNTEPAEAS